MEYLDDQMIHRPTTELKSIALKFEISPFCQICTFLQGATVHLIADQKVPYAVKQNEWVGYDNKESLTTKVV